MIIDILDWDLTYTELVEWVSENEIVLDAINGYGGHSPSTKYVFADEEDFIAFKLKFSKDNRHRMGYTGVGSLFDQGSYYAPYIPFPLSKDET